MSARNEVEDNILNIWRDKRVAKWVVGGLPLLREGLTHQPCPVFKLSLGDGLSPENDVIFDGDFGNNRKMVMSGGFEGTRGHLWSVKEMREARALMADASIFLVLMLEPDSYIIRQKGRQPIANIEQRTQLWSISGLVDAVILLPEKEEGVPDEEHYLKIHRQIAPAVWCANAENPHWLKIITRMQAAGSVEIVRLFKHRPELHTSFLSSTRELSVRGVRKALYPYVLGLVKDTGSYQVPHFLTPEQTTKIILERVARGLVD